MKRHINLFIAGMLLLVAAALSNVTPASARGGGLSHLNSPGYLKALKDSRQRYRESYYGQPHTQPPAVYPRKTWRQRKPR